MHRDWKLKILIQTGTKKTKILNLGGRKGKIQIGKNQQTYRKEAAMSNHRNILKNFKILLWNWYFLFFQRKKYIKYRLHSKQQYYCWYFIAWNCSWNKEGSLLVLWIKHFLDHSVLVLLRQFLLWHLKCKTKTLLRETEI